MNQPARAQEPSMEEILASIRRIIADDDATKTAQRPSESPRTEAPPHVEAPPPPPPPPPVQQVYAAPPPPAPRIEPEPPPIVEEPVSFNQETVAEQSADILDLTESMTAMPEPGPPAAQFRAIDGNSDVGFDEAPEPEPAPEPVPFPPAPARAYDEQGRLTSGATSAAVDFGLQCAGADGAVAERPHARRSGARDASPNAEILARRQSARHGRAHGARRDRTRLARPPGLMIAVTP